MAGGNAYDTVSAVGSSQKRSLPGAFGHQEQIPASRAGSAYFPEWKGGATFVHLAQLREAVLSAAVRLLDTNQETADQTEDRNRSLIE